jgi:hypothetical protein
MNKNRMGAVLGLTTRLGARAAIVSGTLCLAGCAYMESVMSRQAEPDRRIQLPSGRGQVLLRGREIPDYTCAEDYLLLCERSGASSFSCHCVLR